MSTQTSSLKLVVNKAKGTLLFAEAEKHFVDFLLALLTVPTGKLMQLLDDADISGGFGDIYQSLVRLSDGNYLRPDVTKDFVLRTGCIASRPNCFSLLTSDTKDCFTTKTVNAMFKCTNQGYNIHTQSCVSDALGGICDAYKSKFDSYVSFIPSTTVQENGYVKEKITFMVMDGLTISPISTFNISALLDRFNMQLSSLEEKVVDFGPKEATKLLRSLLNSSKTVLTDVYLLDS